MNVTLRQLRCVVCADHAVEAVVISCAERDAVVAIDGERERVAVDLVEEVREGDMVLCHAGVVLARLTPTRDRPTPP